MIGITEDRNINIKLADKGSRIVLWGRENYLAEAEKQFQNVDIYEDTDFKESDLVKIVEKDNTMFQSLRRKYLITEYETKYFSYRYKKSTNFCKMYLLPKIDKRLDNVPGRPVSHIPNCGAPTEKTSEFLDHHLQLIMKSGVSYIKDTNDFLSKLKNLGKITENALLVTADIVGLHTRITHDEGLEVLRLRKQFNAFDNKSIPTEDLEKMTEFVLNNNYFEFNLNVKHQISGTATGNKFAPPNHYGFH